LQVRRERWYFFFSLPIFLSLFSCKKTHLFSPLSFPDFDLDFSSLKKK